MSRPYPMEHRIRICDKCLTTMSKCWLYNERWLCQANVCLQEEQEKDSGKHFIDQQRLDKYRHDVARTQPQNPSPY